MWVRSGYVSIFFTLAGFSACVYAQRFEPITEPELQQIRSADRKSVV